MIAEKYFTSYPEHIFMLRQLDKFMSGHSGFIAGGCFKNLFNHEKIKDIDVFNLKKNQKLGIQLLKHMCLRKKHY